MKAIKTAAPPRALAAIVIGASAGGVHALLEILGKLPAGFSLPLIVALHLPEDRKSQLATIFQHRLSIPVREAADKEVIVPGTLYFAGPGYHLSVEMDRSFSLSCEAPVNHARPSIDFLMESAADAYGPALAGILLTGANDDGAAGLARIGELGGLTIVQDPVQAEARAMPEAALRRMQPDHVLSLGAIHTLLLELGHA